MFLQRTAVAAARRAAVARPVALAGRSFTSSMLRRDAKPAESADTKVQPYKTYKEIQSMDELFGPGAAPGTVPSDLEQATGIERLELLAKMEDVDIFDMKPLEMTRQGTMADPIMIKATADERYVGCTGFPAGDHPTLWLTVSKDRPIERCPECGNVYKMDHIGGGDHHHDDHHHHDPAAEEPKTFADFVKPEYRYS